MNHQSIPVSNPPQADIENKEKVVDNIVFRRSESHWPGYRILGLFCMKECDSVCVKQQGV